MRAMCTCVCIRYSYMHTLHVVSVRTCGSREMRIHFESVAASLAQGGRTHSVKINNSSNAMHACASVCARALDPDDNHTQRHLYKICVHKGDGIEYVSVAGEHARTHARATVPAGRPAVAASLSSTSRMSALF